MMKKSFLIILLLILSPNVHSQQSAIDSMQALITVTAGEDRVDILNDIAIEYITVLIDSAKVYSLKAEELARELGYELGLGEAYQSQAYIYLFKGEFEKCSEKYRMAQQIFEKIDYKIGIADALDGLGQLEIRKGNFQTALDPFIRSMEIREILNDKKELGRSYNSLATVYVRMQNYDQALMYFTKMYEVYKDVGTKNDLARALNNVGIVHFEMGNYQKALEYELQVIKIYRETGSMANISGFLSNLGNTYRKLEEYDNALKYLLEAIELGEGMDHKSSLALTYSNTGMTYSAMKQYATADKYLKKALKLSKELKWNYAIQIAYGYLTDHYKAQRKFETALDYQLQFSALKDSTFTADSNARVAEMQTKYETAKKEKEIELLQSEQVISDLKLKREQSLKLAGFIGSILLMGFLGLLYSRFRIKQKSNVLISHKNSELKATVEELKDSLAHIKRLEGLLPICSNCKKIRHEDEKKKEKTWIQIEEYITDRSEVDFSHGICPDCVKELYPEL